MFLYDVTRSYFEGQFNELSAFGYNRDEKKGKKQIVIGLLTDAEGDPVSVQVYRGNTHDTGTFQDQIDKTCRRLGIKGVTFVGDKGMIKGDQQQALKKVDYHYITSVTKPQIEKLLKKDVFQMSLFDEEVKEIACGDGVRYVLRKNPIRAEQMQRSREQKGKIITSLIEERNQYLQNHPRAKPEVALRKVNQKIGRLKATKWLKAEMDGQRTLKLIQDQQALQQVSRLDGCYVIKSDVPAPMASAQQLHDRHKDLSKVEQAFKDIKTQYLEVRPIYLRNKERTAAHVFTAMLSYKINRYLEQCWKPMDMTVSEAIDKLSEISILQVQNGGHSYNIIPQPDKISGQLLSLAEVSLPSSIPLRTANVYTRKNISTNRKA